jgi:hypothetical protein
MKQTMKNSNHATYKGMSSDSSPKMTTGSRGPTTAGRTGDQAGPSTANSYASGKGGTVGARTGTKLYTPAGSQGAPSSRSADVNCARDQAVRVNYGK